MLDATLLGHRFATFAAVFGHLRKRARPVSIVETGCLRDPGNYAGDGQSTLLFAQLIDELGGDLTSVDISPAAIAAAHSVVGNRARLICQDSVAFLAGHKRPIDLLYLDSFDFDGNAPLKSATHHLFELCAAFKNLFAGSIVLADDTPRRAGKLFGKGMLVGEFMDRIGAPIFTEGETQVAWIM